MSRDFVTHRKAPLSTPSSSLFSFSRIVCAFVGHKPDGALYKDTLGLGLYAKRCIRCGDAVTVKHGASNV